MVGGSNPSGRANKFKARRAKALVLAILGSSLGSEIATRSPPRSVCSKALRNWVDFTDPTRQNGFARFARLDLLVRQHGGKSLRLAGGGNANFLSQFVRLRNLHGRRQCTLTVHPGSQTSRPAASTSKLRPMQRIANNNRAGSGLEYLESQLALRVCWFLRSPRCSECRGCRLKKRHMSSEVSGPAG